MDDVANAAEPPSPSVRRELSGLYETPYLVIRLKACVTYSIHQRRQVSSDQGGLRRRPLMTACLLDEPPNILDSWEEINTHLLHVKDENVRGRGRLIHRRSDGWSYQGLAAALERR